MFMSSNEVIFLHKSQVHKNKNEKSNRKKTYNFTHTDYDCEYRMIIDYTYNVL